LTKEAQQAFESILERESKERGKKQNGGSYQRNIGEGFPRAKRNETSN
jgi:hypothetical protein